MLSEVGMRSRIGGKGETSGEDLENELDLCLRDHRQKEATDRERELNIFRSGSAPPSVEGSLSAVEGLFAEDAGAVAGLTEYGNNDNGFLSEENMRSDPAYLAYYYSHVNLNPRLPPPALSKEGWRFAQRLHIGNSVLGGIGDKRKGNNNRAGEGGSAECSNGQNVVFGSGEWLDRGGDGLIGLSGFSIGSRPKSSNDVFQDTSGLLASSAGYPSRPASCNADDNLEVLANHEISPAEVLRARMNGQRVASNQPIGPSTTQTFASVLSGSLSRAATPDPQRVARVPSPCLPPVGVRIGSTDKKVNDSSSVNNFSASNDESADISSAFSVMNLSRTSLAGGDYVLQSNHHKQLSENLPFGVQRGQNHAKHDYFIKKSDPNNLGMDAGPVGLSNSDLMSEGCTGTQGPIVSSSGSYLKVSSASSFNSPGGSPGYYQNVDSPKAAFTSYGHGGYAGTPVLPSMLANNIGTGSLPPLYENAVAAGMLSPNLDSRSLSSYSNSTVDFHNLSRIANQVAAASLQMPLVDPLHLQYLRTAEYASQFTPNLNDPSMDRNYDLLGHQKAYIEALLSLQNQYNIPFSGKSASLNHLYYSNPSFDLGMAYQGSSLASPVHSAGDRAMYLRNFSEGLMGMWHPDAVGNINEEFASSLLEEFKGSKSKCFELSEIASHVVEFSTDQFGSRFIQQKLETATSDEKHMVFEEIFPQALSLMTDVFGNYVIQKFFEHGTSAQRRELANLLTGHVLTLSLQMYGCRVIQKAIEVVDLDQQTKMVAELDGHVMRCVRDQNGNHVIQKCIECIPQDAIHFIISSFYDQVVTLSTHPYGCRVIQRVLEHCDDPKTQQIVMDEIMQYVCMLAQDQYGNYVIQHVLERGKPHERSAIITQLAGQIVQMSQQKFASNVVEKCLAFGGPVERQILVNEMLGTTDENEPLQAMMKDQFANYVVQKVLETCEDQQRELILSRIKVHLNALKKYTYGKHIVARVEKLVAAGERRIGVQSPYSAAA